jgi:hypothetical protein
MEGTGSPHVKWMSVVAVGRFRASRLLPALGLVGAATLLGMALIIDDRFSTETSEEIKP